MGVEVTVVGSPTSRRDGRGLCELERNQIVQINHLIRLKSLETHEDVQAVTGGEEVVNVGIEVITYNFFSIFS